MAKKHFTATQWTKIWGQFNKIKYKTGLPRRRSKSVVIGSFNIRELGKVKNRSENAWKFLEIVCKQFDLLAIQEVQDDLSGLVELKNRLGSTYRLVVSDTTGTFPGDAGNTERLAYLYKRSRINRTELISDITYDRSKIVSTLFEERQSFSKSWQKHHLKLKKWEQKCIEAKAAGKRRPGKPAISLPGFVTFIRQPHCASFEIKSKATAKSYAFLAVNTHLLYGTRKAERKWEFDALIEWLTLRSKKKDRLYAQNLILLGDCNLDFDESEIMRDEIDAFLKGINKTRLRSKKAATANFPLLTPHPTYGELRTNARQSQTYDQIGIFANEKWLPTPDKNHLAGNKPDSYDYGVFNFTDLIAQALYELPFDQLDKSRQDALIEKCQWDISDHMPVWIRLPLP